MMNTFEFRITLILIPYNHNETKLIHVHELSPKTQFDICKHCTGDYDWISRTRGYTPGTEYYEIQKEIMRIHHGFTDDDFVMDAKFSGGKLCVTIMSDKDFNEIRELQDWAGNVIKLSLLDCIKHTINGILSDGIGESDIGRCTYNGKEYEVWFGGIESDDETCGIYNENDSALYFKVNYPKVK